MFERSFTVGLPNGGGPDAILQELHLSDRRERLYLEAWISNFGSSNVHIFRGPLSLTECQSRLERGFVDMLLTLPASGPGCVALPEDVTELTVFFEAVNGSGQSQAVTLRVTDSYR